MHSKIYSLAEIAAALLSVLNFPESYFCRGTPALLVPTLLSLELVSILHKVALI